MIVVPVIGRELRASARQPFTYSLRTLGVAAMLLACTVFGMRYNFGPSLGGQLFGDLHFTLFWAVWVLVPLLTADCISRERREGTLGLLFLTRLSATDIVFAKTLAHALRALTLWFAALPVLTLPFLLGGVSWLEVLTSAAINFSSICWALAAGLLASAWSKSWLRSVVGAGLLSTLLLAMLGWLTGETMMQATRGATGSWQTSLDYAWLTGIGMLMGATRYIRFVFSPSSTQFVRILCLLSGFSVLGLLFAIIIAGRRTRRVWQEVPPSKARLWWEKTFCTPIFWLAFFRSWMRRKLERNPVGWLEQRRWTGRLVTWGWLAVVISIYSAVLTDRYFFRSSSSIQNTMAWLLSGSLAMTAASSFGRERETGVMELLLVSPLGEAEIIWGRLRGLWGQFLPAFGLLLGIWAYFSALLSHHEDTGKIFVHAISFFTLPVVGLYFSLRCGNFIAAFLSTLAVGLLVPILLAAFFRFVAWAYGPGYYGGSVEVGALFFGSSLIQMSLAAICARGLYERLKRRAFRFIRD